MGGKKDVIVRRLSGSDEREISKKFDIHLLECKLIPSSKFNTLPALFLYIAAAVLFQLKFR